MAVVAVAVIHHRAAGFLVLSVEVGCKNWYIVVQVVQLGRKVQAGVLGGMTHLLASSRDS